MAVKIRLKRIGKIRAPFYRIVVADARKKRDGRVIEEIGTYNPKTEPSTIHVDSERAQYWLGVGAQPTEAVAAVLKLTGDIGGERTLREPEPKRDKAEIFNEALKDREDAPKTDAVTPKKAKKADADEAPAEEAPVEEAAAEESAPEATDDAQA